jgi:hypothetical protein
MVTSLVDADLRNISHRSKAGKFAASSTLVKAGTPSHVRGQRAEKKIMDHWSQLQNCVGAVNYWDLRADF